MELWKSLFLAILAVTGCCGDSEDPAADCKAAVKGTPIERFSGTRIWRISDKSGKYSYEIGVCNNVGSNDEAVIQRANSSSKGAGKSISYVVGRLGKAHLISRQDYIELEYFHGDYYNHHCNGARRTARIIFVCDPCGDEGGPAVVEEMISANTQSDNAHCFYLFEWPTSVVCSAGHYSLVICNKPHLSTGSILLIVFFSLFMTYLIGGCVYKRFVQGAKGIEQLPHIRIWKEMGNLTSDGCDFLCRSGPPHPVTKIEAKPQRGDYHLDAEETDDENDGSLLPM